MAHTFIWMQLVRHLEVDSSRHLLFAVTVGLVSVRLVDHLDVTVGRWLPDPSGWFLDV